MDLQNIKHLNMSLHLSLHSAIASGNETDYRGYSRISIPLDEVNWIETNDHFINRNTISFPACTLGEGRADVIGICESVEAGFWDILHFIILADEIHITEGRSLLMPPVTLYIEKKAFAMMRWKTQATTIVRKQPVASLSAVIHTAPIAPVQSTETPSIGSIQSIENVPEQINVPLYQPIKVVQPLEPIKVDKRRKLPKDENGKTIKILPINSCWYYKSRYKNAVTEQSRASIIDQAIMNLDTYELKRFEKWKDQQSFQDFDPNVRVISREDKQLVKSASQLLTKIWYYKSQFKLAKTDEGKEAISARALQNLTSDDDRKAWLSWLLNPVDEPANKEPKAENKEVETKEKPAKPKEDKEKKIARTNKNKTRVWYHKGHFSMAKSNAVRRNINADAMALLSLADREIWTEWYNAQTPLEIEESAKGRPHKNKVAEVKSTEASSEPTATISEPAKPKQKKSIFYFKNRFKMCTTNSGRKVIINKAVLTLSASDSQKFVQWTVTQPELES